MKSYIVKRLPFLLPIPTWNSQLLFFFFRCCASTEPPYLIMYVLVVLIGLPGGIVFAISVFPHFTKCLDWMLLVGDAEV